MLPVISRNVTMEKDGKLTLNGLPFQEGDSLEVSIVPSVRVQTNQRDQLRGTVLQYRDPFAPVGLDDWDALK
ncbi:MAG: hypothetical protein U0796_21940 [Gemmatales bacterium]